MLLEIEKNDAYANLTLNRMIRQNRADDPAFVRELVYGVLKNKRLLDYQLTPLVSSGLAKVKAPALTLLRMGVYQIAYMGSVPEYAAVNETVRLAKVFCRGREGFMNGVLRAFLRQKAPRPLPDRKTELEDYLSIRYSACPALVRLWTESYGAAEAEQMLAASMETPRLCLRVNLLKGSREALIAALAAEGYHCVAGSLSDRTLMVMDKGTDILRSRYFREGWFSVQDQASTLAADLLHCAPGHTVVDLCAAPGGKTMAMAEMLCGEGKVYAFDLYPHRVKLIEEQAARLGIGNVTAACRDSSKTGADSLAGQADRVLVDVPCSGLGVIRRKPEIKLRPIASEAMTKLLALQQQLLENAGGYVKPGGMLLYSTCTCNPAENTEQISAFLAAHDAFSLQEMRQLLPGPENDGFFISVLLRR